MTFEIVPVTSGEITPQEREHSKNIEQNIRNYAARGMLRLDDFWIGGSDRVRGLAIERLRGEGWVIEEDRSGTRPMYTITPPGADLSVLKTSR